MGWICSCGEGLDDTFDQCWNCGRDRPAAARRGQTIVAAADGVAETETASSVAIGTLQVSGIPRTVPFKLLSDERVVADIGGGALLVTTHRVRSYGSEIGSSSFVSIMLDQVASCSVKALSKPLFLVLAGFALLLTLAVSGRNVTSWIGGLLVASIFVVIYVVTQRRVVSIASSAAAIQVDASTHSEDTLREIIDKIEEARHHYGSLRGSSA